MLGRNNVALVGSVIGLSSLFFSWLTLRPNRLAAGTHISLWDSAGWAATAIIILWLACLVSSLSGWGKSGNRRAIYLGMTANIIVVVALVLVGLTATLLVGDQSPLLRVSLGAGFWITLAGAYIAIFAARERLRGRGAWRNAVSWTALAAFGIFLITGLLQNLSIWQEFSGRESRFLQELGQHLFLLGGSVATGVLLGIPLGIWAVRSKGAERPIFFIANITQTVPSLALFGFLIPPLSALSFAFPALRELGIRGVGTTPALIALTIYSLLPIVRNTYVGLRQVDPAAVDAGLGMGMSGFQIFRKIEAPLAAPLVLQGVRIASVQVVGLVAVAALIGAGGLGWFIFQGIGQAAPDLILLGAIPIIALALMVDAVMRAVVRLATPKGTGKESQ